MPARRACRKEPSVLLNMLNRADSTMGRHLIGRHLIERRSRRLRAEAAEVAEIDRWLARMRSGPEMVLYPAHPTVLSPAMAPTPTGRVRPGKKRRR